MMRHGRPHDPRMAADHDALDEIPLTNAQAVGVLIGLALLVGLVLAAVAYWRP